MCIRDRYCIGYVKGSKADCGKAQDTFTDACVCALSKVAFDTYTSPAAISTPIAFRVDLAKSNIIVLDKRPGNYAELYASMPTHPVPPRSVADVARINTARSTDLIAVIKRVIGAEKPRKSKTGEDIVDVELVDTSMTKPTSKLAEIVVSIFGADKIKKLSKGATMVFFNLSVTCGRGRDAKPSINHYSDQLLLPAGLHPAFDILDQAGNQGLAEEKRSLTHGHGLHIQPPIRAID